EFIGLNANEPGRNPIDRSPKRVERNVMKSIRKFFLKLRIKMPPEAKTPSDIILPQARLRFMDTERHSVTHRRAIMLGLQSLVVQSVSDLVHQRKKSASEILREVTHPDSYVARSNHRAEWMLHDVESSRLQVESKR